MIVPPEAIFLLPAEAKSRRAVMEHIGFADIQALNPDHECFVVAFKILPGNPFAVVFRVRKDVVHIQGRGWHPYVDAESRWCVVERDSADFRDAPH